MQLLRVCLCVVLIVVTISLAMPADTVDSGDTFKNVAIPAFPGAEGAGAFTPGGRGGKVFEVTSLADGGPGSLREAVEAEGPRIVIFRISSIIVLKKPLTIPHSYITIQWCISSEALDLNNHAFGATWGGKNGSFHHNLFACNTGRNPSIGLRKRHY